MARTLAIGLTAFLLAAGAAASDAVRHVLVGTYTAEDFGGPGPIRAAFSARESDGEAPAWSVVFTVTMDTADYHYRGTARGALDSGELSGELADASGERTFLFRGEHRDGALHATHAETTGGFLTPTGTMTLRREVEPE